MIIRADLERERDLICGVSMGSHLAFGAAHSEKAGSKFKSWLKSMSGESDNQDVKKNRARLAETLKAKGAKHG